jgi:hypothetical protein
VPSRRRFCHCARQTSLINRADRDKIFEKYWEKQAVGTTSKPRWSGCLDGQNERAVVAGQNDCRVPTFHA